MLLLFSLGFSKCSVILFLRQLFTRANYKAWNLCTGLLLAAACWTVISVIVVSAGCSASGALAHEAQAHCSSDVSRWKAVTGIDVCFELILVIIPAYLFSPVKINLEKKLAVFGAFVFRVG
jgi:hypothetical protein